MSRLLAWSALGIMAAAGTVGCESPAGGIDHPEACVDRGTYDIEGITVRGLAATCDGDGVCREGACVALPACTSGVSSECLFTPEGAHGPVKDFTVRGDYIYWLELGSKDQLNNYNHDAAVARTKIGTWMREQVSADFDLGSWVESAYHLLAVTDEAAFISGGNLATVVARFDGSSATSGEPVTCMAPDGIGYVGTSAGLEERNLLTGATAIVSDAFTYGRCILAAEHHVWWHRFYSETDGPGFVVTYRLDRTSGETVVVEYGAPSNAIGEYGEHLVASYSESSKLWIATSPTPPETVWRNVGGGTKRTPGRPIIAGDYVYWVRTSSVRKYTVILRAPLSGSGEIEVVAELSELFPADIAQPVPFPEGSQLTVGGQHLAWFHLDPDTLHYVPLPMSP